MTEKQEETCENCGHDKLSHAQNLKKKIVGKRAAYEHCIKCADKENPCKKFKAKIRGPRVFKNHSPQGKLSLVTREVLLSTPEGTHARHSKLNESSKKKVVNSVKRTLSPAEKSLSEKRQRRGYINWYFQEDVKEAVKRLKKLIKKRKKDSTYDLSYTGEQLEIMNKWNDCLEQFEEIIQNDIDKIFGEDLI